MSSKSFLLIRSCHRSSNCINWWNLMKTKDSIKRWLFFFNGNPVVSRRFDWIAKIIFFSIRLRCTVSNRSNRVSSSAVKHEPILVMESFPSRRCFLLRRCCRKKMGKKKKASQWRMVYRVFTEFRGTEEPPSGSWSYWSTRHLVDDSERGRVFFFCDRPFLDFLFFFTFCFSLFWPGTMACTVGVEWTVLMRVDRSTSVGRRRFFFPFRPVRFSFVSSPNRSSSSPRPQWDAADGSGRSGTTYVEKQPNTHGDDIKTKVKKKTKRKKNQQNKTKVNERKASDDRWESR